VKTGVFALPALIGVTPFAGLQALADISKAALEALTPAEFNSCGGKALNITLRRRLAEHDRSWTLWAPRQHAFTSETFRLCFSLPNFHFHAVPTFDIQRSRGVPLAMRDRWACFAIDRPRRPPTPACLRNPDPP
jgi:hypothetical protein